MPIGLFNNATYDEITLRGQPGDLFLFFSDGILDATSSQGELFGRQRLEKIVKAKGPRQCRGIG